MSLLSIGADPGSSVGVAALLDWQLYGVWQTSPDRALVEIQHLIDVSRSSGFELDIAAERFTVLPGTGRKTQQPDAADFVGRVRAISPVEVRLQQPSDARRIASNERLRKLGLYVRPYDVKAPDADDANSAMRHVLLLLAGHHATLYEKLLRSKGLLDTVP